MSSATRPDTIIDFDVPLILSLAVPLPLDLKVGIVDGSHLGEKKSVEDEISESKVNGNEVFDEANSTETSSGPRVDSEDVAIEEDENVEKKGIFGGSLEVNVGHEKDNSDEATGVPSDVHQDLETDEKLQTIRVKFLRLAHRLGQTPYDDVSAQVLDRLGIGENLGRRNGGGRRVAAAYKFESARAMAEQLEAAAGQEALDFSCTIMVLGATGVGKSATINSIFDEHKCSTDAFQLGTEKVQDFMGTVQGGIKVRVIDTPGLVTSRSWSDQCRNEKILHSIKRFIRKSPPDVVWYVDRLDMQMSDFGDMPLLLRTITKILGPSIWFCAILVLTHAASAEEGPSSYGTTITTSSSSYDTFVTQRSRVIQQAIRNATGEMRLMNPVSLVENNCSALSIRTNKAGQRVLVLPNGQVWKPHLLFLSSAQKILAEAYHTLQRLQDTPPPRKRKPVIATLVRLLMDEIQSAIVPLSRKSIVRARRGQAPPLASLLTCFLYPFPFDQSEFETSTDKTIVICPSSPGECFGSFDSDDPTYRYIVDPESFLHWTEREVRDKYHWDHEFLQKRVCGIMMHYGDEGKESVTRVGFSVCNDYSKDVDYTLYSQTSFRNKYNNRMQNIATAVLSVTHVGDALTAAVIFEDKLIVNKYLLHRLVLSGGASTGRGEVAYGCNLEATWGEHALGCFLSSIGLCFIEWPGLQGSRGINCNANIQIPIGRCTNLICRVRKTSLNMGYVCISLKSSKYLPIALLIPLLRKLLGYFQGVQQF